MVKVKSSGHLEQMSFGICCYGVYFANLSMYFMVIHESFPRGLLLSGSLISILQYEQYLQFASGVSCQGQLFVGLLYAKYAVTVCIIPSGVCFFHV